LEGVNMGYLEFLIEGNKVVEGDELIIYDLRT